MVDKNPQLYIIQTYCEYVYTLGNRNTTYTRKKAVRALGVPSWSVINYQITHRTNTYTN